MRITEHTPDRLVVEDRPLFPMVFLTSVIGLALLGGVLALIEGNVLLIVFWFYVIIGAFFAMRSTVKRRRLLLDRTRGLMSIGTRRIDGAETLIHPLDDLEQALVQPDKRDPAYQDLVLRMGHGPNTSLHRVTEGYTGRTPIAPIAETINSWLSRAA